MKPLTIALALLAFAASFAHAAPLDRSSLPRWVAGPLLEPSRSPNCGAGLLYDDGSFESGADFPNERTVDMLMRFDLPAVPMRLEQMCVCWTRTGGDSTVSFDVLVYDDAGSQPGALLTGLAGVQATGVPLFPQVAFYEIPLATFGITIDRPRVFLGPSWDTVADDGVMLCSDDDGGGLQPEFYSLDEGATFTPLAAIHPASDSLGVRADFGAMPPEPCVAGDTTLCLASGRFEVELDWRSAGAAVNAARVVPFGADDSGLFYFQNSDNWELLVKIVDACSFNDRFWVFFAATTNVELSLTVRDTESGQVRSYNNPLGQAAMPVQDTQAFATCS